MDDVQAVHDKIEIKELLYRYARACDTKDWALLTSVFTPDAYLDYTSARCPAGPRDEIVGWLEQALTPVPMTQHFVTNIEIDLDGDRAKVRAMFYNPMHLPGMAEMSYCGGNYHHDVVRTPNGWKSERLVEENLWFVNPMPGAHD
jgi:3-phenylpropionate/cinnamic acid dioxygenase small subunit